MNSKSLRYIILFFLTAAFNASIHGQTVPGSNIVSRTYLSADSTRLLEQRMYDNGLGDVQFGVYRKEEVDRVVSDEEIFEYQEKMRKHENHK